MHTQHPTDLPDFTQARSALSFLQQADTATLLLTLAELSGDAAVLERWGGCVRGPTPELTDLSDDDARDIRTQLHAVLQRQDVHDDYNQRMDERLAQMVWSLPTADTWCRSRHGRVTANMPWASLEYWQMARHPQLQHYTVTRTEP